MAVRRVDVAALLAGLGLEGCYLWGCEDYEDTEEFLLSEGSHGSYVGEDFSSRDCEGVCQDLGFTSVEWCSGPSRTETESTGEGDTAVYVSYEVTCTGMRRMHCVGGRRPPALGRLPRRDRVAVLEAASIHAFLRLHRELELHGAPASLRRRCLAAARDEVRHARLLSSDGRVPRVRVGQRPLRSLAAIARDNAVEGCVHETWGALVAHLDPRPVYRIIAADELRHAQLAWDIEAWLGPRARSDLRRRAGARLVARTEGPLRPWAEAMRERLWG